MKGLVAALAFVCYSLLAGSAMPEYQGPDSALPLKHRHEETVGQVAQGRHQQRLF